MLHEIACLEGIAIQDVKSMHARPDEQFPDERSRVPLHRSKKALAPTVSGRVPRVCNWSAAQSLRIDPRKSSGPLKRYSGSCCQYPLSFR